MRAVLAIIPLFYTIPAGLDSPIRAPLFIIPHGYRGVRQVSSPDPIPFLSFMARSVGSPTMMRPFLIALGLLTRMPVFPGETTPREQGRAVLAYPLVGAMIGLALVGLALALRGRSDEVRAVLVLIFWVWATGGLHLDGLADSVDAWVGGMGDRSRTLAIMKDPASGPAAVTVITLILLLKFVMLKTVLMRPGGEWMVLLPPILGRGGILLLFLTTPYVRAGGMGAAAVRELPRQPAGGMVAALAVLVFLWPGVAGWWVLSACLISVWWLRRMMRHRLGGTTGDTAGALCELSETAALLALAFVE